MNSDGFRQWLQEQECNSKVISDHISRLHRLERELSHSKKIKIDIDTEYKKDSCKYLFSIFFKSGKNYIADALRPINLPLGSYSLNTIKYSLKKYVQYLEANKTGD